MTLKQKVLFSILGFIVLLNLVTFMFLKGALVKPGVSEQEIKAKVAIVIDDWGYNLNGIKLLRQINVPLTISVLPNLKYSTKIANIAKSLDQEVIVHLPLEPELKGRDDVGLEENTITTKMDRDEVIAALNAALATVPYASGVSNHMGSLATRNEQLMSTIFEELKKRNLFFLDNVVTSKTICEQLAKEKDIKCTSRDVFLDNRDDAEYINRQFEQLQKVALSQGEAIGIGHAKIATLEVLKEKISLMQAKGIEFVFISDLIK